MTREEELALNKAIMNIANSKNKKYVELTKDEHTAMIPLMDVLAELRGFLNYVRSKDKESHKQ